MEFGNTSPVLDWTEIGLKQLIQRLSNIVTQSIKETPKENTRALTKMERWQDKLENMHSAIQRIQEELQPELEEEFDVELNERGLLTVSLLQPSTKNVFLEIRIHYRDQKISVSDDEIAVLVELSEVAKVLGLLGDAVIDIAVLHHLWEPNAARVGTLTKRRSELVSNEHLADVCDRLGLYNYRIHFDPETQEKSELEHIKGTLVEALFGVIYMEHGFDKSKELASLIL